MPKDDDKPLPPITGLITYPRCWLVIEGQRWLLQRVRCTYRSSIASESILYATYQNASFTLKIGVDWTLEFERDKIIVQASPGDLLEIQLRLGEPERRD
jgi:hypothetical protein